MGVERTNGTETRPETTDSPNTRDRPYTPPPDNPGSPGQPSRLESLRRAREEQLARAAEIAAREAGTEQRDRPRQDTSETSSTELAGETQDTEPEDAEAEREPDAETDEAERPDVPDEEPDTRETDRPAPGPPDETGQPQDGETATEDLQEQDRQPLPRHEERSSDTGQPPQNPDEPTGPGQGVAVEQALAPEDQRHAEDQPRTPEPEAPAPQPDRPPAADESVVRWSTPVYRVDDRTPGTQVEARDRNTETRPETPTTNDGTDYRTLPDLPGDGTPGRGELRPPEDDPADRDAELEESRRSRWEPFERLQAGIDGVKKATEGAKGYLDKPPPTGKAEVKTDTGSMNAPNAHAANPTDMIIGGAILATAVVGVIMRTKDKIKTGEAERE